MITQSRQYNNQQLTIVSRHDTTIAKSNVDDKRVSTNPAPVVDIEFPKKETRNRFVNKRNVFAYTSCLFLDGMQSLSRINQASKQSPETST